MIFGVWDKPDPISFKSMETNTLVRFNCFVDYDEWLATSKMKIFLFQGVLEEDHKAL